LLSSLWKARKIIKSFQPNIVIGTGGFASGPLLQVAASNNIPTLIQEQNSYPGITNKILSKKAEKICVAYDGLERFFPKDKIIKTGNPVRQGLLDIDTKTAEAKAFFKLKAGMPTLLVEEDLDADFENKFSQLVASREKQELLGENIKKLALVNATKDIADEVEKQRFLL